MSEIKTPQQHELEWWQNYDYMPFHDWANYDKFFINEYIVRVPPDAHIADVGSGPTPYSARLFPDKHITCIDPLANEYRKMAKYETYQTHVQRWMDDITKCLAGTFDAIVCTNTLDHVSDPEYLLTELARICKPHGLLYFMCDVNKPPDWMHPMTIDSTWLQSRLETLWTITETSTQRSWKFDNEVLFAVGIKRDVGL